MNDLLEGSAEKKIYSELNHKDNDDDIYIKELEETNGHSIEPSSHFELNTSPQNFGNNFCWLKDEKGQPQITLGPDWPLFACTCTSFIAVDIILIGLLLDDLLWASLTFFICTIHILSYLWTALQNPGIAHKHDKQSVYINSLDTITDTQREQLYCKMCDIMKDSHTYHCESCNVCIRGYDHHCPWTGKCIAQGNIKQFNVFLVMTFFFIIYAIVMSITTLLPMNKRHFRLPSLPQQNPSNSTLLL